MAAKKQSSAETSGPTMPETAYETIKQRLATQEPLAGRGRLDPEEAANVVLSACEFLGALPQLKRLEALPADEWDMKSLVDARVGALAVRHCRALASSLDARESSALVPASVVDEVAALKRRALQVLGYWVEDSAVQNDLADIAQGSGYADATEDLERLARLLQEHAAELHDPRFDAAKYAKRARELADTISGAARANSAAEWQRELRRALAFMLGAYAECAAAAAFLFRKEPLKAARVPSVYGATRKGSSRRKPPLAAVEPSGTGES